MTRKRSSYRPRNVNPTAHLVAIHGAALLGRDDRTIWALQMRAALDAVREARASKAHWDTIFDSVNLAEELTRMRLASDPSGVIRDAQQACADIIQRLQTTGTRAARAGELAALWDLEAAMIDILAGITHAERFRAEERIRARTRAALAGGDSGGYRRGISGDSVNSIEIGDCRDTMRRWAQQGVKAQMCVTSPPYFGLRDYGHPGQIGLEPTPEAYIDAMVEVFRCVRDVLADDGTLWLNIGDSYSTGGAPMTMRNQTNQNWSGTSDAKKTKGVFYRQDGCKAKDLIGIPWMLAFALRSDGWYLRQDIIWHKPNPMPESVRDRCTKAHEYIFLMSKSERYFFDSEAMQEEASGRDPGNKTHKYQDAEGIVPSGKMGIAGGMTKIGARETRNRRSVWTVATQPYSGAHFATFPPALIEPCILAGSRPGDIVLDPFMGSGTTAQVAQQLGRQYIGCELNPQYLSLQHERTAQQTLLLA